MTEVLQKLSDETINEAQKSLDSIFLELKKILGEERHKNEIYVNVLWLSNLIDDEYFRRKDAEAVDVSKHNLNYDYKDSVIIL